MSLMKDIWEAMEPLAYIAIVIVAAFTLLYLGFLLDTKILNPPTYPTDSLQYKVELAENSIYIDNTGNHHGAWRVYVGVGELNEWYRVDYYPLTEATNPDEAITLAKEYLRENQDQYYNYLALEEGKKILEKYKDMGAYYSEGGFRGIADERNLWWTLETEEIERQCEAALKASRLMDDVEQSLEEKEQK